MYFRKKSTSYLKTQELEKVSYDEFKNIYKINVIFENSQCEVFFTFEIYIQ